MPGQKVLTKKRENQNGGFIFGGSKKKKRASFKTSMTNFCKVTRDGNNIPKGQKVTRNLIHEVCSNFYELEDNAGFFGSIFNFAINIAKKPVELAKGAYSKISSSAESVSNSKSKALPLDN